MSRRSPTLLACAALVTFAATALAVPTDALASSSPHAPALLSFGDTTEGQHLPASIGGAAAAGASPALPHYCEPDFHFHCYTTTQIAHAYGFDTLHAQGLDGSGRTVLVSVSFGSPTLQHDVAVADRELGLPAAHLTIDTPLGPMPPYDPTNPEMTGWAFETTLDVELIHAYAPGATIDVVEIPTARDADSSEADDVVIRQGNVDVMNQSWSDAEPNHPARWYRSLDYVYDDADELGVTSVACTGDAGATAFDPDGTSFYPYRTVSWPSDNPLDVAAGGTQLSLDKAGDRTATDVVWNDQDLFGAGSAAVAAGGLSRYYARPSYQNSVAAVAGNHRALPDVSLSAAIRGAVYLYISYLPNFSGWSYAGGTSEAAPTFSALVAIADQLAGHRLGNVLPELYRHAGERTGVVDVTSGDNTFTFDNPYGGDPVVVHGYPARPGYDLSSGLGTINAPRMVATLAAG